jgi:hypothetical protein
VCLSPENITQPKIDLPSHPKGKGSIGGARCPAYGRVSVALIIYMSEGKIIKEKP